MGTRRTAIAPIGNSKNRRVTFAKRKQGLFKKAWEMSVLTQCEVLLVLRDVRGRLFQFAACFPTDPNAPDAAARTREPTHLVPKPHNGDVNHWIQRIATGRAGPVVETRTPFYYDKGRPNLIPSDAPSNDEDDEDDDPDDLDAEDETTTTTAAASTSASASASTTTLTEDTFNIDDFLSGSASSNVHDADTQNLLLTPPFLPHHHPMPSAALPLHVHRSNSGRRRTLLHMPGSAPIVATTISRNPRRKVSIRRRASQKKTPAASNPLMGALDMCLSPVNVEQARGLDESAGSSQPEMDELTNGASATVRFNPDNERAEAKLVANYYAVHASGGGDTGHAAHPTISPPHTGSGAGLGRRGTVAVRRPKRSAATIATDETHDGANKRLRVEYTAHPPTSSATSFLPNDFSADTAFLLPVPGQHAQQQASPALSALSSPGVGNTSVNGMLSPYRPMDPAATTPVSATPATSPFDQMLLSMTSSSSTVSTNGTLAAPIVPDIFLTESTQLDPSTSVPGSYASMQTAIAGHSPMHLATSTGMPAPGTPLFTASAPNGMSPVMLDTSFSTTPAALGPYSPAMALGGSAASTTPQMLPATVAPSPFLLATAFQQQQQYMSPMLHATTASGGFPTDLSLSASTTSTGFLSINTSTAQHFSPLVAPFTSTPMHPSPLQASANPYLPTAGGAPPQGASPYLAPGVHSAPMLSPLAQALGTPLTSAAPTPIVLAMDASASGSESASQQLAHILGPPMGGTPSVSGSSDLLMLSASSGPDTSSAAQSQVIAGLAAPSDFLGVPTLPASGTAGGQQDAAFASMWFASPTPGVSGSSLGGHRTAGGSSGELSEDV